MTAIRIPNRSHVTMTGETDPIRYHYQPIIRYFMNKRLMMGAELLGGRRFRRLLDAGYGGGVFLPELASRADALYGIDLHPHVEAVQRMAVLEGVQVELRQGSICQTGFPDAFFDGVVSISVLEFVDDLDGAVDELARITAPGGTLVLGFPGENALTTAGYRLARTPDPRRVHRATYEDIFRAANRRFTQRRMVKFPAFAPDRLALFFAGEFERG